MSQSSHSHNQIVRIVKGYSPEPASPRVPRKTLQERMARQAAIEGQLARYIPIVCGHYTTLDAQDVYLVCRPKRGMVFCESCEKWEKIAKPPEPAPTPQEPLF